MDQQKEKLYYILGQAINDLEGVRQAKIVNIDLNGVYPVPVVALTLPPHAGKTSSDAQVFIKSARKALIKGLRAIYGPESKALVPKSWLILQNIPETPFGTVDEDALRHWLMVSQENSQSLSFKERRCRLISQSKCQSPQDSLVEDMPTTDLEFMIQMLWAQIFVISPHRIKRSDSFLALGGDSITAVELVAKAQQYGITMTAASILQHPRLSEMAALAQIDSNSPTGEPRRYSSIKEERKVQIKEEARRICQIALHQTIEDVYPCTTLQEGLMALGSKDPGLYIHRQVYCVPNTTNIEKLKLAWNRTVQLCENLRTRVVVIGANAWQVVVQENDGWVESTDISTLKGYLERDDAKEMSYGNSLCRYALIHDAARVYFVVSLHHAIFDGLSVRLILDTLHEAYSGSEPKPPTSFSVFIEYLQSIDVDTAEKYWVEQLRGAGRPSFPPLTRQTRARKSQVTKTNISLCLPAATTHTKATMLRAAWAIVLARYCDSDDVCFGTSVSGRQAPVPGIGNMVGLLLATVPIRICLDRTVSVKQFLDGIQAQASSMVAHEQLGLQNIAKLGGDAKDACEFTSLLVVQPIEAMRSMLDKSPDPILFQGPEERALSEEALRSYFNYPLVLQTLVGQTQVELNWTYDTNVLSGSHIVALNHHLDHVVQQLVDLGEMDNPLSSISLVGRWDEQRILEIRGEEPEIYNDCLHEMIATRAKRKPDAMAIDAWDGQFTFSELEKTTDILAEYLLRTYRVEVDELVHLCFEKSAWFIIAAIAVNKAGGAWVPLDPSHPFKRQQQVVQRTGARLALSSREQASLCGRLVADVVVVTQDLIQEIRPSPGETTIQCPVVSPTSAVYALFTSGSTGEPKALVMEHGAACTGLMNIGKKMAMSENVRILQFASYVFDVSVGEIFASLIFGASVCVPSEDERMNNLRDFVRDKHVNWLFLTPTYVRTMKPSDYPGVDLMMLAGEAVGQDLLQKWIGHVRLFNGWGPAETCVISTLHEFTTGDDNPLTIGRPVAGFCYVVDASDPSRLAPIGCVGEIVVQGPTIFRGYLKDPEKTKECTIYSSPEWAYAPDNLPSRLYKSGDLGYYDSAGRIVFSRRKDTQIKIRGFRVELGEIEHHMRRALHGVRQVVVDVLGSNKKTSLVAYLCFNDNPLDVEAKKELSLFLPVTETLKVAFLEMAGLLRVALPQYMVPSYFIPCRFIPWISSTKVDRRRLQAEVAHLDVQELYMYSLVDSARRAPITRMEARMQRLWARNLKIAAESIGRDDNYLQIGGDSIAAIHLVAAAREDGVSLTVKDIFDDPRLCKVAAKACENAPLDRMNYEPFSLLSKDVAQKVLSAEFSQRCGLSQNQFIQDAFPCTKLQEGLMAIAVKQPTSYIAKKVYPIPINIDLGRFVQAWTRTVEACQNLRTRLIYANSTLIQAVIKNTANDWEDTKGHDLESYMRLTENIHMGYGDRLCRYAIIKGKDGRNYFILALHHAIFDGWTLQLINNTLKAAYRDGPLPIMQSYSTFVQYTKAIEYDAAAEYWKKQLLDTMPASFPRLGSSASKCQKRTTRLFKHTFVMPDSESMMATRASVLRAAWALVLARYSDIDDICFGATVSGRNAALDGILHIPGLVSATVPIRVKLDASQRVSDFINTIQSQATDMVAYEQFGLQEIAKLGPDFKLLCKFTSLFAVQPKLHDAEDDTAEQELKLVENYRSDSFDMMQTYFDYPLVVQCHLGAEDIDMMLFYDPQFLDEEQTHWLGKHFEHVTKQLFSKLDYPLSTISVTGPCDLQQAMKWNAGSIAHHRGCIMDLIAENTHMFSDKEALWSTEGSISYGELGQMTTSIASRLLRLGVTTESVVPFCFEKSIWAVVAMLGILKAGAVFMPLDPSYPIARKKLLIKEAGADQILLASPKTEASCAGILQILIISSDEVSRLPNTNEELAGPHYMDAAYVIFTSGSTGTPKAIVMEHSALYTSTAGQAAVFMIDPSTRALQFSNYVFDGSLGEILTPLAYGGTVCVPSETERMQDISDFIRRANVNTAMLTPSFVRTIDPRKVPSLRKLILGGETAGKDVITTWYGTVKLMNGYGPAEACNYCLTHVFESGHDSPSIIGRGFNSACWIVDPDDHNKLAPIGCTGELVVEGFTLARGYYNDPERTSSRFFRGPSWASAEEGSSLCRYYKTGDLVRYTSQGLLEYLGRKDTQVKLRGQRIETGEVEYHIKNLSQNVIHVVVDIARRHNSDILTAFITFNSFGSPTDDELDGPCQLVKDGTVLSSLQNLRNKLRTVLPLHMVPGLMVPVERIPFIKSMKVDRRKLQDLVKDMPFNLVAMYSMTERALVSPTTEMELSLRSIWAELLHVSQDEIGKYDSFLHIGGDSILAIHLVALAERQGIRLTVADIFHDSQLASMAASASICSLEENVSSAPFALISEDQQENIRTAIKSQADLQDEQDIQDAYPCTPLQEGLMALSSKQPGSYTAHNIWKIAKHVDIERFKDSWERVVEICGILRTRIFIINGLSIQAIIRRDTCWEYHADNSTDSFKEARDMPMTYGTRLCRFAVVRKGDENFFSWTIHHAIFDGWTTQLVLKLLQRLYYDMELLPVKPYSDFIGHLDGLDMEVSRKFWASQLQDVKRSQFPPAIPSIHQLADKDRKPIHCLRTTIEYLEGFYSQQTITTATVVRVAWALVLSQYCNSNDICFGATVSGRQAPVAGILEMAGPVIATVPVRVCIDYKQPVMELLETIQNQSTEAINHEQYGLQRISKINDDIKEACKFSSLLVVQPVEHLRKSNERTLLLPIDEPEGDENVGKEHSTYPLVLRVDIHQHSIELRMIYNTASLHKQQVVALSAQFENVLRQIMSSTDTIVNDISVAGPFDLDFALRANPDMPQQVENTICQLIETQCKSTPDSMAIDAWNWQCTYRELLKAAKLLAIHLKHQYDVRPGDIVPICFEKSAWYVVALLAVNRAGATWVPLDPAHPPQRLRQIVKQTSATLAISSPSCVNICAELVPRAVILSEELHHELAEAKSREKEMEIAASPNDAMYIIFTSGSTGSPKGVVIEHGACCTSMKATTRRLGMTPDWRCLLFSSHVFDGSVVEIFGTLISGACICIPSEHVRLNDVTGFIQEFNVTAAWFTPSFSRTIVPARVPSLNFVGLVGEAGNVDDFERWLGRTRVANCWGPSEVCVVGAIHEWKSANQSPRTIGTPVGSLAWIVDVDNPTRLSPVGCVGEIMMQGPALLRGYLDDPQTTAGAKISPVPSWAPFRDIPSWDQFYKTGDLGFYNPNGTIEYCGRKDTQVKIRGLRVELSEVEHHLRANLFDAKQVVVDVCQTRSGTTLVCYICFTDSTITHHDDTGGALFEEISPDLRTRIECSITELCSAVPQYMIPTVFVPCRHIPLGDSAKLDRNALKRAFSALPEERVAQYSLLEAEKIAPATEMEHTLQKLWASTLKIPLDRIGRNDNFFQLGGDSIAAIHLVSAARDTGIQLVVGDVFAEPQLSKLATRVRNITKCGDFSTLEPFCLLDEATRQGVMSSEIRQKCNLLPDEVIEDAYPCTPLQEGMMALSVKQPGSYVGTYVYELSPKVDITNFQDAWEETLGLCPILRSRIVLVNRRSILVTIRGPTQWSRIQSNPSQHLNSSEGPILMTYGTNLSRHNIIKDGNKWYFAWTTHHAVHDGWSVNLVLRTLQAIYSKTPVESLHSYNLFSQFCTNINKDMCIKFWSSQLQEAKRTIFSAVDHKKPLERKRGATKILKRPLVMPSSTHKSFTSATILRAAWALLLSRSCKKNDVCFGTTVSGRHANLIGIDNMPGPTLATVPVRCRLNDSTSVAVFLEEIQTQAAEMVEYEQFGLRNISKVGDNARDVCDFSHLLIVQPMQNLSKEAASNSLLSLAELTGASTETSMQNYFSYPLVVQVHVHATGADLVLIYKDGLVQKSEMLALSRQYEYMVQQLLTQSQRCLGEITLSEDWDLHKDDSSNAEYHGAIETGSHTLPQREHVEKKQGVAAEVQNTKLADLDLITAHDQLRELWAEVLEIDMHSIKKTDSFIRLGGDSVSAIQLVSLARERGFTLTVAAIFEHPELAVMGEAMLSRAIETTTLQPFSLLRNIEQSTFEAEIRKLCCLPETAVIEDAFPCTKVQEGLMALTAKHPGSYVATQVYNLPDYVDHDRFRTAWNRTCQICSNLRTRIVVINGSTVQVVVKEDAQWESTDERKLEDYIISPDESGFGYGMPLSRFALLQDRLGDSCFVWTAHHSIFDGWTLQIVLDTLSQVYHNLEPVRLTPYVQFIHYIASINQHTAMEYWKKALSDANPAEFPPPKYKDATTLPSHSTSRIFKSETRILREDNSNITHASILRAAWAIVLAHYCDTDDICFGATVSGRQAAVPGLEKMAGPTVSTVPVRIRLDKRQSVAEFLEGIQRQAIEMIAYEQYGLQSISKINEVSSKACNFSSLLAIQPSQQVRDIASAHQSVLVARVPEDHSEERFLQGYFNYPLVLQCFLEGSKARLLFVYDSERLSEYQLLALSHHYDHIVQQLQTHTSANVGSLHLTSQWDVEQAMLFNCVTDVERPVVESCFHELVDRVATEYPNNIAISAWDGEFTYNQLIKAANRLAFHLVNHLGIQVEDIVPVLFQKSAWYFVATLAISKVGAAWAALDPSHPLQRQQHIINQTKSTHVLCSKSLAAKAKQLASTVVEISSELDNILKNHGSKAELAPDVAVSGNNTLYIVFTSGSTGMPKGVVIEHMAVCTSMTELGRRCNLTPKSRFLQFASYSFDMSVAESVMPFLQGACICIPSDHDCMNNIQGFIRGSKVDSMILTPSFAKTIYPDEVPLVNLLLLGGEAASRDLVQRWFGKVKLINVWGPTETAVVSAAHQYQSPDDAPTCVGKPLGGFCWIVNRANPTQLAPIGTLGELVIQTPTMLRGYLNDPLKSQAAIMTCLPEWMPYRTARYWTRAYKSGDLASYNADGQIVFHSRKDNQVKVRGQRVELGEIESHIQTCLTTVHQTVVEVVETESGVTLAAYFCPKLDNNTKAGSDGVDAPILMLLTASWKERLTKLLRRLENFLPRYMMPTLFIPCHYMPLNSSHKLDRKALINLTKAMTPEALATYTLKERTRRQPSTEMECQLQQLWSQVLKIPKDLIGRDDSFLEIGGDSIGAIHLVTSARRLGISLTVKDIFDDPRLSAMSSRAETSVPTTRSPSLGPFDLLENFIKHKVISIAMRKSCHISAHQVIEDAFPCTKLQEGLMILGVTRPGSYIAKYVYKMSGTADLMRFKSAWEHTVESLPCLRTRIVNIDGHSIQLVVKNDISWESSNFDLDSYIHECQEMTMEYGSRLNRYALVTDGFGQTYFVLALHHAVHDGWTFGLIHQALYNAYRDIPITPLQPYVYFVRYTRDINKQAAHHYWDEQLKGATRASFPPISPPDRCPGRTRILKTVVNFNMDHNTMVTKATVIRAAWSIVLARYSETDDICFGATVSGRQAPVSGITEMAGPAITTVPIRIRLDKGISVSNYLINMQSQATEMIPFEQYGLQEIQKVSQHAREACNFSSLLVVQPLQRLHDIGSDECDSFMTLAQNDGDSAEDMMQNYLSYPLAVQARLWDDRIELVVIYDSDVLSEARMEGLAHHFEHVFHQLLSSRDQLLGDISVAGPWDMEQIIKRDKSNLSITNTCLHDLVSIQAAGSPTKEAIFSTERSMTYHELDTLSQRFASYLRSVGVRTDTIVPFGVEKSIWSIVVILGIMKAGGVFAPIDPKYPRGRKQTLIDELDAQYLVVSDSTSTLCVGMTGVIIKISDSFFSDLSTQPMTNEHLLNRSKAHNGAYILFTSGSTGTPKGVLVKHSPISSALLAQGEAFSICRHSRVLQFANYVFDASIVEIFTTLIHGGTVCVPTENERMQMAGDFMTRAQVNTAVLTPSVVRMFDPNELPTLKTLVLCGEAPPKDLIHQWFHRVELLNAYGPTEGCIGSTVHRYSSPDEIATTIGHGFAHRCWIVDPDDHHRLAPVGCSGELLIQGHAIAQGYINDEPKTMNSFIRTVEWMPHFLTNDSHKLYKTGDLVRYNSFGCLEYLGRKDAQVKIRGQRIELGEIEYQISQALGNNQHVVVDKSHHMLQEFLVAFICTDSSNHKDPALDLCFLEMTGELTRLFSDLKTTLSQILAPHMVPAYFVPVSQIPTSTSGKIDRRLLLRGLQSLSTEAVVQYLASPRLTFRECSTTVEYWLRSLWARALGLPEHSISVDDNFYDLGGDSIRIVTVAKEIANEYGVTLSLPLINSKDSTIGAMAKFIEDENRSYSEAFNVTILEDYISTVTSQPWAVHPQVLLEQPLKSLKNCASVFLTGATGFLGTEILHQLLRSDRIGKVVALVRSTETKSGLDRVRETASIAGWWHDDLSTKLEIWIGDLSKPRLGLSGNLWARLEGKRGEPIDAIIHNGAVVNWHADWHKLQATNCQSTVDLLEAVTVSRVDPKFVFVSGGLRIPDDIPQDVLRQHVAASNGYIQTKFVSDKIINTLSSKFPSKQNRISIVMPGRIIGTKERGVSNVDDLIWRLVAAAAAIGAYPEEPADRFLYLEDVSVVAASIINQITEDGAIAPHVHVEGGLPIKLFWDEVNSRLDTPCQPLPWEEWKVRALAQMNEVGEGHPLYPIQHFLGCLAVPRVGTWPENESFTSQREAVGRSVAYLKEIGFILPFVGGESGTKDVKAITRCHRSL